jgi:hypothetical protein
MDELVADARNTLKDIYVFGEKIESLIEDHKAAPRGALQKKKDWLNYSFRYVQIWKNDQRTARFRSRRALM